MRRGGGLAVRFTLRKSVLERRSLHYGEEEAIARTSCSVRRHPRMPLGALGGRECRDAFRVFEKARGSGCGVINSKRGFEFRVRGERLSPQGVSEASDGVDVEICAL